MAQRSRKNIVTYGGEKCGTGANGDPSVSQFVPRYSGIHLCIDETHPGPPYRTGGPLYVWKRSFNIKRFKPFSAHCTSTYDGYWDGFMGVYPYIPASDPTPLSLAGWGAIGWNRTYPLHPIYQLGVSIAELKDVRGMITQTRDFFRTIAKLHLNLYQGGRTVGQFLQDLSHGPEFIGSHYLNLQFGWAPFLQDLFFITQMRNKVQKKIDWLRKQNGKSVKRHIVLDKGGLSQDIARNITPNGSVWPPMNTSLYAPWSYNHIESLPIRQDYERTIWYSAKYKFWIPELADENVFSKKDHSYLEAQLLGLDLDPTIIYKVMPWTWLLDWFTSVGAVVQNIHLNAKYGVVADYAYVMCSESYRYQAPGIVQMYTGSQTWWTWVNPVIRTMSGYSDTLYEFRQREVANPYGFGITFASLSAYQWSILAALGLSRRSKHSSPRP